MKKGFTLVELIISIILITAISVASLFIYLKNKNDDEAAMVMQEELEEATNIYYSDNFSNGDYKYYQSIDAEGKKSTISCMKLETLVNDGLIDGESKLLTKYSLDTVFAYIVDDEGFVWVNPLDSSDKTCEYISMEEGSLQEIKDDDETVDKYEVTFNDEDNKEWKATYDYSFINGIDSDFKGNIVFNMALTQEITKETINPLYIVVVLDSSGSMDSQVTIDGTKTTRYKAALAGINNLISTLNSEVSGGEIYLGSVSFYSKYKSSSSGYEGGATKHLSSFRNLSTINKAMENYYTALKFPSSPIRETTDCEAGLVKAATYFNSITDSKAVKIVIFLADGACNESDSSVSSKSCDGYDKKVGSYSCNAIKVADDLKKQNISVFTIGYVISSGSTAEKTMQYIASKSKVCDIDNNYETEQTCYFSSTEANIGTTFSQLAKSSIQASIENPYNKVTFTIKLADYFKFLESSINTSVHNEEGYRYQDSIDLENNTLTRTITIYDKEKVNALKVTNFDYEVNFLADKYKEENSEILVGEKSSVPLDILSSLNIEMSGSGNPTLISLCSDKDAACYSNDLPKITVDLSNNSVVN